MIYIKKSRKHGKGVFASETIKVGTPIVPIDDSNILQNVKVVPLPERDYINSYNGKEVLWGDPERYINHSCEPNVYIKTEKGVRNVIAMREIKKGTELVFDYRIGGYGASSWKCNCGAKTCSKNCDKDFFKLPEEKQMHYLSYLDNWFLKMFTKKVKELKFKRIQKAIKSISNELLDAYVSFFIFDALRTLRAPNKIGGKKAEQNVKTMTHYGSFFSQTERAHHVNFLLVLSRFFDDSKQSLSLIKTKNWAASDRKSLDAETFLSLNKDRYAVESLAKAYEGLTAEDLKKIEEDLKKHSRYIKKLIDVRNKTIAHKDSKGPAPKGLTVNDVLLLFQLVERILNTLANKLDHNTFSFGHAQDDAKRDTELVIEHLKRFEPYRLKEIKDKYENLRNV